jgi:hypothetical protein
MNPAQTKLENLNRLRCADLSKETVLVAVAQR